jgi:nitrate reductase delta subunit
MQSFKIIAALLHYPDEALQTHADELIAALDAEGLVTGRAQERIVALIRHLRDGDLLDLQETYVETFDRGRARSLYLFEHVHGESRDRGQAMVDLQQEYQRHGFAIAVSELPDYLPMFLEFLSTRPPEEAAGWLEEVGHLLQLLHARLREHDSSYAVLVEPLVALAGIDIDDAELREQVAAEERDDTPEALDRVWMEAPVTFGPEGGCPSQTGGRRGAAQPVQWGSPRGTG